MEKINVGERIKNLRVEANIKPKELASKSNLDISQIYKIESGKANPSLDALIRICNSLNISLSDFFNSSENQLSIEQRKLLHHSESLTEEQIGILNKLLNSFIK